MYAVALAVDGLGHTALLVMVTRTLSLLFRLLRVNVNPVPALTLFTNHWYVGVVPPFTGLVAVNVTLVPVQIGPDGLDEILMAGVTVGVTVRLTVRTLSQPFAAADANVSVNVPLVVCPP